MLAGVEEAQGLAEVKGGPFPEDIISYAGFLTVNETSNGNLFFWYFQAEVRVCINTNSTF